MKKPDYTKFNEQNFDEILNVLSCNSENAQNQNVFTFSIMQFMKIVNQLTPFFEDVRLESRLTCSYVNTKFMYAYDTYKTKPFHVKSDISHETTALFDANIVEFNSLYPAIYAKAFSTGELDVEIKNFNKLFIWLFDNRGLIRQHSAEANFTAKYILNAFYGVLSSNKRAIRSTATECLITKFFNEQVLPHIYQLGLYYWNVDEFIYRKEHSAQVQNMLDMICLRNGRISYDIEYKAILHIDENKRLQRFLNYRR